MFIGVSTASLYPMETEKAIDKLAELGIKNIEIFLEANCEAEQHFCKLLKDKLDFYGINVVSVHSFCAAFEPFLFSEYRRRSNDALLQFTKVCKAMGYLGASYYTFHGNRSMQSSNRFSYREYSLTFSSLARIAKECGGLLAWENVSWCQSGSVDFLKNCMQYLDYKDFGFTLDLKQALRSNDSVEDYLDIMSDNLVNVHVSDYNKFSSCVLPGDGERNFEEVISLLNRCNYDKALIIEVYNDCYTNINQIKNSVNFLEGLLPCYE